jgi:hypothetical protein
MRNEARGKHEEKFLKNELRHRIRNQLYAATEDPFGSFFRNFSSCVAPMARLSLRFYSSTSVFIHVYQWLI